ncbi:MAG: S8 family serine peptidase [Oligoflexia bacterium]|nr:S8 family serine peptidase [Oligoflexia bacterium]
MGAMGVKTGIVCALISISLSAMAGQRDFTRDNFKQFKKFSPKKKKFIVHKKKKTSKFIVSKSNEAFFKGQMNDDPDVVFVEEDIFMTKAFEPGDDGTTEDPYYQYQWHYFGTNGINLPATWDITKGKSNIVVAVLDTGITNHADFGGRLLPGADLVTDLDFSNDGNGRDSDASDPGDWVEAGDVCYQGSFVPSSWHGTHVAGTIGANGGNGVGATGVNFNSKILPVRVLGKCGGYLSDIADGVLWAVGEQVSGLPVNQNPADVINLSLGGFGSCGPTMQNAIDVARSKGAVVVVAAGNDGQNLDINQYTPANCSGVITVGAGTKNGQMSFYSNYGDAIDVTAPGGDSWGKVVSLSNTGSRGPVADDAEGMSGTSMAAPHVAGVASLILSVNPDLYPAQVEAIIKETSDAFSCSGGCGSGWLNALEAVILAQDTIPDPNFQGTEPIKAPSGPEPVILESSDSGGGMCGSVDLNGGNGSGGPGGGFPASILAGLLLAFLGTRTTRKAKIRN